MRSARPNAVFRDRLLSPGFPRLAGWRVICYAALILPVRSGAQSPDATWRAGEGIRGVNGKILATALWDRDGAGEEPAMLVAAGEFSLAGTTPVNNIALWNGSTWEPLGTGTTPGVGGEIRALAVLPASNELVAAGVFRTAGGAAAEHIALWNGTQWSNLGPGLTPGATSSATSLAVMPDGALMVGGHFSTAGDQPANNIARWSSGSWTAPGTGLGNTSSTVLSLAVRPDGLLAAGGSFTTAGGVAAARVATWDGTSWSPLNLGLSANITALAYLPGGDLLAGGEGANVIGGSGSHVLRWNGASWSGMSAGFYTGVSPSVLTLKVRADGVPVAGGAFTLGTVSGTANLAFWNGSSWTGLGGGTPGGYVASLLEVPGPDLVIGGNVVRAGGIAVEDIARWDGTAWHAFGSGFAGAAIHAFARLPGGDLVAGGSFQGAGTVEAMGVVQRNGSGWEAMGSGVSDARALAVLPGGDLLAAGSYLPPGSQTVQPLARWDGSQWSKFGPDSASFPTVLALAVLPQGDVIAAGAFNALGGVAVSTLARWNGSAWSALGAPTAGTVYAAAVLPNGDLIVGGEFDHAGGVPASRIARWDGSAWFPLGSGMNGTVLTLLALPDGTLLAGGRFGTAGGESASRIARWNGTQWAALGLGVAPLGTPSVQAITRLADGDLIIGGTFTRAGSTNTLSVARWNGSDWSALGGVGAVAANLSDPGGVNALAATPEGGFVMGGSFFAVNGYLSRYFAEWGHPAGAGSPDILIGTEGFRFSFSGDAAKSYRIGYSRDLLSWKILRRGLRGTFQYEESDGVRRASPEGYYRVVAE